MVVQGLSSLRHMELQGNQLSRIEDLNLLRKYVCCLTVLDLRANPMAGCPSYQALTLRRLPHLASLDGRLITQDDWEHAAASHGVLSAPLIQQNSFTRLLSIWSDPGTVACVACPCLVLLSLREMRYEGTSCRLFISATNLGLPPQHLVPC